MQRRAARSAVAIERNISLLHDLPKADAGKRPETRAELSKRVSVEHGCWLLMVERSQVMGNELIVSVESEPEDVSGRVIVDVDSRTADLAINFTGTSERGFSFECKPSTIRELAHLFAAVAESVKAHHTSPTSL